MNTTPSSSPGTMSVPVTRHDPNRALASADGSCSSRRTGPISALPGQVASLDGTEVFYLRFDAEVPGALPVVLTYGWPSSFLELTELARRLAAPSRHGGSMASKPTWARAWQLVTGTRPARREGPAAAGPSQARSLCQPRFRVLNDMMSSRHRAGCPAQGVPGRVARRMMCSRSPLPSSRRLG